MCIRDSLGTMCEHGIGIERDYPRAVELYQIAANQGHAQSQYNLPELFDEIPKVGKKRDIHSFAMTLWEIASRDKPDKGYQIPNLIGLIVNKREMHEIIPEDT